MEHDAGDEPITEVVAHPSQMTGIVSRDCGTGLDLDADQPVASDLRKHVDQEPFVRERRLTIDVHSLEQRLVVNHDRRVERQHLEVPWWTAIALIDPYRTCVVVTGSAAIDIRRDDVGTGASRRVVVTLFAENARCIALVGSCR